MQLPRVWKTSLDPTRRQHRPNRSVNADAQERSRLRRSNPLGAGYVKR
jgi:hypothetical protein